MAKAKTKAPLQTLAEDKYLKSISLGRAPIGIKYLNGRVIEGTLEGFDAHILRVARKGQPGLVVYKDEVKYLWERTEASE
jgi:sRNA-binding regulator protein Hfq